MNFKTINPANEVFLNEYQEFTSAELEKKLTLGHSAFKDWSSFPISDRVRCLRTTADLLKQRTETYASLITTEMGKPIKQARAEVQKCALVCEYYAENAEAFLASELTPSPVSKSFVSFEPLGLILGIMPWNYPFWQVFRFMISALAAGNGILLKHAPNVFGSAMEIEKLLQEAGFPLGLMQSLILHTDKIPKLIADSRVKGVSVTGSVPAGQAVAAAAAPYMKKLVLELGGSDPYIILEDAPFETCLQTALLARLNNTGQSCIAAKRFIVHEKLYEKFCNGLVEAIRKLKVGDPHEEGIDMGPLARLDLLENLDRQVKASIQAGAKLLYGGQRLERPGFFYPPTILSDVQKGMAAFDEETFGPVFAMTPIKNSDEAIRMANDSSYGLGASLWTQNIALGEQLAAKIESGNVYINMQTVSNPALPFGGIKLSGYGRELSLHGIREFVNIKTISIKTQVATYPAL